MEVVAGSISRIDVATRGDLKFSFARDLANIARNAIHAAKDPISDALPSLSLHGNEMSHDAFCTNSSDIEVSCEYAETPF